MARRPLGSVLKRFDRRRKNCVAFVTSAISADPIRYRSSTGRIAKACIDKPCIPPLRPHLYGKPLPQQNAPLHHSCREYRFRSIQSSCASSSSKMPETAWHASRPEVRILLERQSGRVDHHALGRRPSVASRRSAQQLFAERIRRGPSKHAATGASLYAGGPEEVVLNAETDATRRAWRVRPRGAPAGVVSRRRSCMRWRSRRCGLASHMGRSADRQRYAGRRPRREDRTLLGLWALRFLMLRSRRCGS